MQALNINEELLIKTISTILEDICIENSNHELPKSINLEFQSTVIPKITFINYLKRLWKYFNISKSTIIFALIYVDRLIKSKLIQIQFDNIHKIFLTALFIAVKFNEDIRYEDNFLAKIGGLPMIKLCRLEFTFLRLIGFRLFVDIMTFEKYLTYIELFSSEISVENKTS